MSNRVVPNEKHQPYYYLKKICLLVEKKKVVYPLTITLLGLVIAGHIYSVYGKRPPFPNQHFAVRIVEGVADFFLTASLVIITMYLPRNAPKFFKFFTKLYPEGNRLFGPLLAMKKNYFWRNFFICHLCVGVLIGLDAAFFLINFGWNTYKYSVFRDVQFYVYNLAALVLLAVARKLELRFSELNELLEYKTEKFLKNNSINLLVNDSDHFYSVRTFKTSHYDLCNLVKYFNEMFGRIILSTVIFNIANILAKVTFLIEFYVTPREENEWSLFTGIACLWIVASMGQSFFFALYGDQITKEGEKTTKTCFYLLNKVSFLPRSDEDISAELKDELKTMAFQSYTNLPRLSAGGFFDVNFKVLGLMISSVTSYLMVIIQFLLRPSTN